MASRKKRATQTPKKHIIPLILFSFLVSVCIVVGLGIASAFALVGSWLEDLPSPYDAAAFNVLQKTTIYASDGTTILAEFYFEDREPVSASQVSKYLFDATVAVEDERYWEHIGVDLYAIARALVVDLLGGNQQGGSTITQQLVRQTLLIDEAYEQTFARKAREAYLAMELERIFGKEQVLMMYLNTINYGDGSYGIQSAAKHYFSKDASELTLAEAALLAGIPQSPTFNNPVAYPDNALKRRNNVLYRMKVNGYITEEEYEEACASDLNLNVQERRQDGIYEAHFFVVYVRELLKKTYGSAAVFGAGWNVYTTLDIDMQRVAEQACAQKEATSDDDVEVSLVSIEPSTGYIKALRGGKDFYADQFSTATDMSRAAGSTFKAFALVACLELGISPQAQVSGTSPVTIEAIPEDWVVTNFGGQSFRDDLTLAEATWLSSNTAYARVVRAIGPEAIINVAHRMGIKSSLVPLPSVVLGAQGVNTLEMASAYSTLATGGVYNEPIAILKITDSKGNTIFQATQHPQQVISEEVAYAANTVLQGVVTGGTATSSRLWYQPSAGKTGTSDDYHDSWFVGYTPQLSTAVWIGSRVVRYIPDNTGGVNCCPVWKNFMDGVMDKYIYPIDFPTADPLNYNPSFTFLTAEEQAEKKQKDTEELVEKIIKEEAAAAKDKELDLVTSPVVSPVTNPVVTSPVVTNPGTSPVTNPVSTNPDSDVGGSSGGT